MSKTVAFCPCNGSLDIIRLITIVHKMIQLFTLVCYTNRFCVFCTKNVITNYRCCSHNSTPSQPLPNKKEYPKLHLKTFLDKKLASILHDS